MWVAADDIDTESSASSSFVFVFFKYNFLLFYKKSSSSTSSYSYKNVCKNQVEFVAKSVASEKQEPFNVGFVELSAWRKSMKERKKQERMSERVMSSAM